MRRGTVEFGTTLALIIFIVALIALLSLGFGFFQRGAPVVAQEKCMQSIVQNAGSHIGGFDFSSRIDCPTEYVTATGSADSIKKTVATKMASCWKTWGEGKQQLFAASTDTFCAVCDVIDLDQDVTGFLSYLKSHNVQAGPTYYDYLAGIHVENGLPEPLETSFPDSIDRSKPFSIVFTYAKKSGSWDARLLTGPFTADELAKTCTQFPASQSFTGATPTV